MTSQLAAIPLRREPNDRSEMTSQILFGEIFDVLEEEEKWMMVKLRHDEYIGWVDKKQVIHCSKSELDNSVVIPLLFASGKLMNGMSRVLPAGALVGHLPETLFKPENELPSGESFDIVSIARMFIGAPYLWGGRTFMGIDCSGLTQIILRLSGKKIPRDAYQQAETGMPISFVEESMTGDLAFFDNQEGRITHVGLVIVNGEQRTIIHASGQVREDFLDHQGIYNESIAGYSHNLRIIKRII